MAGLYTGATGLWGGFAGLLFGSTSLSTPPGLLADVTSSSWTPASLFANGEPGFWYSNTFSTLYQDSAGTIPVTAYEQPVGLRLDQSKGLVLGSELNSNPGPFSNTTGYAAQAGASISVVSNELVMTTTAGTGVVRATITGLVSGSTYKVSFTCRRISGTGAASIDIPSVYAAASNATTSNQTFEFVFRAPATTYYIDLNSRTGIGDYGYSLISIKQLPGNHASQSTSASRPVLSARYNIFERTQELDNSYWIKTNVTVTANAATAPDGTTTAELVYPTTSGTARVIEKSISGQASGVNYKFRLCLKNAGLGFAYIYNLQGNANFYINLTTGATSNVGSNISSIETSVDENGWVTVSFITSIVSGTTAYIYFGGCDAAGSTQATTSGTNGIYAWGADLRVSNESSAIPAYQRVGAATYGTSTSAGVPDYDTTGFPGYLLYNGSNRWMQTANIDFTSTGYMNVFAGVRKLSDAAQGIFTELSVASSSNAGSFALSAPQVSANYSWLSRGSLSTNSAQTPASYPSPITNVLTAFGSISSDISTLSVNAIQVASSSDDQGTGNYGNYPLYLGARAGTSLYYNGRDYGLIGVGALLPASQISNATDYMDVQTFGKNMIVVYSDELTTALGELITAADGDQIYMVSSYV